ncbi:MAG TPA: hypothetical protein VHF87_14460 [Methylomirabilota bacterium]|jgi:hypothetical protein|nr:hypothetical protein [Methylomirabilota bacterium]
MVAVGEDRWQAGSVRRLLGVLPPLLGWVVTALAAPAGAAAAAGPLGRASPMTVQAESPPASPDAPRVMAFSWTLYPRMWAEIDLRLAAGAEAVAEVTVEGGEVSWNLHVHPEDAKPMAFLTLQQGSAAHATVRCAPDESGRYSYLFGNDGNPGPVRLRIELRLRGDARLEAIRP